MAKIPYIIVAAFIVFSSGGDPKGQNPNKLKNIWPALAGYIFFRISLFLGVAISLCRTSWNERALLGVFSL